MCIYRIFIVFYEQITLYTAYHIHVGDSSDDDNRQESSTWMD